MMIPMMMKTAGIFDFDADGSGAGILDGNAFAERPAFDRAEDGLDRSLDRPVIVPRPDPRHEDLVDDPR